MSKDFLFSFFDVCKNYQERIVLDNCNFSVHKNELIGLIGSSGSGKTTLIKLILGLEKPTRGRVVFNSDNLNYEELVGYVSQGNLFYEELSVYENLKYYAKLYKIEKEFIDSRIEELLELTHLNSFKFVSAKKLSGGMKRRLELALGLINDPKILILDEPFSGLDIKLKTELWEFVKKINKSGLTIIISTHLIELVKEDIDKLLLIKDKTIHSLNPNDYKNSQLMDFY